MIEYVKGELTELTPTLAVVECHGVGYGLNISLGTYSAVQGKTQVKLYVYEAIREDAYLLWGFATKLERDLFLQLITVSGIGAGIARMILSAFTPSELCNVIASGNERALKSVKGIGPKAAQRIIVDLRDKLAEMGMEIGTMTTQMNGGNSINKQVMDEAVAALTMLGFSPAPSSKVVTEILTKQPDATVEDVIKKSLKML